MEVALRVRRFFCDSNDCAVWTFADQIAGLLLGAYLFGDDSREFEIDEIVPTEGPQRACLILDELRRLLADPTVGDDELTSLVETTSPWMIQTGRITLEYLAVRLAQTLSARPPGDPG